jgi:hypothetical protein
MEPDTTLLTQPGLLIAHCLIDSSTKQLATMIANCKKNENFSNIKITFVQILMMITSKKVKNTLRTRSNFYRHIRSRKSGKPVERKKGNGQIATIDISKKRARISKMFNH